MKRTPVCPILQLGVSYLETPQDIMLYVLRHFIYAPKGINDTFNKLEVSLSYIDAEFGGEIQPVLNHIQYRLVDALNHYFQGNNPSVTAKMEKEDDKYYSISIKMEVVIDGKYYSTINGINIDKANNNKIILNENDNSFNFIP